MNTASEQKQFGFWGNLSVARKLTLAFGILFVFAAIIAIITLTGMSRVQSSYTQSLEQGVEMRRLSSQLLNHLLQARRAEKNFLLRWQEEGYDTAYNNYVVVYKENLTSMREIVQTLAGFGSIVAPHGVTQTEYETDIASLSQYIDTYEQSFDNMVEALGARGENETVGLEKEIRDAAHVLEGRLYDHEGLEDLAISMLQMRRREKDYLLRQDQASIDGFKALGIQLKIQITESEQLLQVDKPAMRAMVDAYVASFEKIVAQNVEIVGHNKELIASSRAVEPLAEKISQLGVQIAANDVAIAETTATQTLTASITIVVVVLVLSIFLAVALSRQITRPITQLTKTAEEIAGGNFETQAEVLSGDEVGVLAATFNSMTSRLRVAFEDVRRRALAVQTSAEVSRRLSMATSPRQLAVDVVEQVQAAFKYYHAHIYFLDETTGDLVMAGGTGEAGATMLARGHKVPKGRGLVGRAADTNAPVLVPDVTQAEGWLPNPLLPATKAEAAIPISAGSKVLGVLDVQHNIVNGLNEEDVDLLKSLAGQVSISLQNARSFEESRAQAELEAMVNAIGQKIQRAGSMEETLQIAIRELGTALGASRVSVNIQSSRQSELSTESVK